MVKGGFLLVGKQPRYSQGIMFKDNRSTKTSSKQFHQPEICCKNEVPASNQGYPP